MAGKRQHYLPQLLQRGFASSLDRRRTWLYREDAAPREVGMRDVGIEENFYSVDSDGSLDAAITEIERDEFVEMIEHFRSSTTVAANLLERLPSLIAHLEVRSRHLRTTFGALVDRAWNDQLRHFDNPALGAALVRKHVGRNPAELRAMAARELRSKGLPVTLAPTMAKQTAKTIAEMPDELLLATFWKPLLPHIRNALKARLVASIKQAHVDALRRSVAPDVRALQYRHLRFAIVDVATNDLVLGIAADDIARGMFSATVRHAQHRCIRLSNGARVICIHRSDATHQWCLTFRKAQVGSRSSTRTTIPSRYIFP